MKFGLLFVMGMLLEAQGTRMLLSCCNRGGTWPKMLGAALW